MTWPEWLVALPGFRARRALAEATDKLRESKRELDHLREQAHAQSRRLEREKRKRRRLERRLAAADGRSRARPLLVFDHIPKTAGTTFRRSYLTAALEPDERWILGGGETNARDRERLLSLSASDRARIRIVAGHDAESLRPHLPDARFVTIVREPVERAISTYLHARFHPGGKGLWADVRENDWPLAQFARKYIPPNLQSRRLLGEDFDRLDAQGMSRRLNARYALVGHTEAFDEFVFLLHATQGLPLCMYSNRLVRSERRAYAPPAADVELVRRMNTVDALLHQVVRQEFQARVERLPEESRASMRRFLQSLEEFRGTIAPGSRALPQPRPR